MIGIVDSYPTVPPTSEPPMAPEGPHYPSAGYPQPPVAPRPPRHRLLWSAVATLLIALLLVGSGAAIGIAAEHAQRRAGGQSPIATVPQPGSINIPGITSGSGSASSSAQAIAGKVTPAIVDIDTVVQGVTQNGAAAGTGMIVTSGGEVLTNNHVIEGATSITVTIQGKSGSYKAHVLGADPTDDVALIQVEGVSGLPTVKIADASSLSVGQSVVAIGNALGRGGAPAVTEGSITALDQTITASDGPGSNSEQLNGMIQTDASISPGDSGGALINQAGQVVGMITAGQSSGGFRRRSSASSVGFAIPASAALAIVNQIRSGNPSNASIVLGSPSYLGVSVRDLDTTTAGRLGISVSSGALVVGVVADSPAAQIGITQNAVITNVGGTAVTSTATLGPAIRSHKPGSRVSVTWVDGRGTHTATATLVAGPAV